ncbi:20887_t:CDS:1, partial [Gigaspora rosea]
KTDREIKFVSCNKEIQTISQNKPIELNDIDGLQQLISLINQVQQLQSQNIPTLEQPDKPKPKPGQPIETEEPEEKPDYDLIYGSIEKEINKTTRPNTIKLLINELLFNKIKISELTTLYKTLLHQLHN